MFQNVIKFYFKIKCGKFLFWNLQIFSLIFKNLIFTNILILKKFRTDLKTVWEKNSIKRNKNLSGWICDTKKNLEHKSVY